MDEAEAHPAGDERGLPGDNGVEEGEVGSRGFAQVGVVAGDGMIGQRLDLVLLAPGGEELEGPDAQVAGGDAGEDRARELRLAPDLLSGRDHGQRARGRHPRCGHELRDQIFAQHGADGGLAVAPAREGGTARAFQLDVEAAVIGGDDLAQKMRAAVAELGREAAELVAGIGLGDGVGTGWQAGAGKPVPRLVLGQVEAQRHGQRAVQDQKPGGGGRVGGNPQIGPRQVARPGIVELYHASTSAQICGRPRAWARWTVHGRHRRVVAPFGRLHRP